MFVLFVGREGLGWGVGGWLLSDFIFLTTVARLLGAVFVFPVVGLGVKL